MPAIYLFKRKTLLGGDDLQIPALISIGIHFLAQLCLLLIPAWIHIVHDAAAEGWTSYLLYDPSTSLSCRHVHLFPLLLVIYTACSTAACIASIYLDCRLLRWTSVGSPTSNNNNRSKHVESILEMKLLPFAIVYLLIFMTGICAICFAKNYQQCKTHVHASLFHQHLWWFSLGFLLFTQFAEAIMSIAYISNLLCNNKQQRRQDNDNNTQQHHELVEEMWATRCAEFCHCLGMSTCFLFGGRELQKSNNGADYGAIARALADYVETRGVLDVVPSDIVAAFLVLRRMQRKRILQERAACMISSPMELATTHSLLIDRRISNDKSGSSSLLYVPLASPDRIARQEQQIQDEDDNDETENPLSKGNLSSQSPTSTVLCHHVIQDCQIMQEGARYARYALAIYTWVLYLYVNPISGIFKLLTSGQRTSSCLFCCGCDKNNENSNNDDTTIIGDHTYCQIHKNALLLTAQIPEADLVYAQLQSTFRDNPYCILLDHEWKSVVVAIRGTFSLEDCVTDVLIEPESLESLGQEFGFYHDERQYCHGGVLVCVRNVYRDLKTHGLLEKLLLVRDAPYRDYSLRIAGHSLGAATATILSYMLRQTYPTLKCFNYSPPGCTMSWELATQCHEWCTSFVLDSDLVPRLSFESMEQLRDELLELLGRIKVPKMVVTEQFVRTVDCRKVCCCCCCCCENCINNDNNDFEQDYERLCQSLKEILYDPDEVPQDNEYQRQLRQFKTIQQERRSSRGRIRSIKLYPPGRLIHLYKMGEKRSCLHKLAKCATCFTTNVGFYYSPKYIANDALDEIVVSPTMGTDHFPNRICFELERVAKEFITN